MPTLTVSTAARQLSHETGVTIPPHVISTLFYKRRLDDDRCPVVSRIRLIPEDYLPTIKAALQEQGVLPAKAPASK
jgi:hypothetical protein